MHGQIQFLCLVSAVHFARKNFLLSATYFVQSQFTSYLLYETVYKFLDFSINSWICVCGYNNTCFITIPVCLLQGFFASYLGKVPNPSSHALLPTHFGQTHLGFHALTFSTILLAPIMLDFVLRL